MSQHEHEWVELYRQIPWTVDDFDPDRLAPERSRYAIDHEDEAKRGQPHTDEDHAASVATPRPVIVVKCYGCDTCEEIPVTAKPYKRVVGQLARGEILQGHPDRGNDLTTIPLVDLFPELRDKLEEYGLAGRDTGATKTAYIGDEPIRSGLQGDPAQEQDARMRKLMGLPPRDAATEAERAGRDKWEAEGRKASTKAAEPGDEGVDTPEVAPEVAALLGKADE